MQIYPAIDLKGGRAVRWIEGDTSKETTYSADPVAQARAFVAAGASWIHVVDLDRAFKTGGHNTDTIRGIVSLANVRVQLGGNIETLEWARDAVALKPSRVVLGTRAALRPRDLNTLAHEIGPDRCALALDTRDGSPAARAGTRRGAVTIAELVRRAVDVGIGTVVYRDLARDGLARGADIDGAVQVARLGIEVVVAGGVASLSEIRAAAREGLAGVIVGRALHEGRFTLQEALACSS